MSRRRWVLGSLAVLLIAGAVVVRYAGDPVLLRFPLTIDQTAHYRGTATLSADPGTMAPLATPMVFPLTVDRQVKVVSGSFSRAVVDEIVTLKFAGQTQVDTYRYLMDRRTMQLLDSPQSYAFGNKADRMSPAGSYRINLELGSSSARTYKLYGPETDSAALARPTGPAHHSSAGVDVVRYTTTLDDPLAPYYLASLRKSGFPAQLTAAQVAAQLQSHGVDVAALVRQVAPSLTGAQVTQLQQTLARPVPLSYRYFQQGWVDIEPTTGALIDSSSREGVSVVPDVSSLRQAIAVLAPVRTVPAVQALSDAVAAMSGTGPRPALTLTFAQTPASVASMAALAKDQAGLMGLVRWQLPLGLAVLAVVALLLAALWRPRRPAPITELPVVRPQAPAAATQTRRPA